MQRAASGERLGFPGVPIRLRADIVKALAMGAEAVCIDGHISH